MASAMMWATRREFALLAKNCSPTSCSPANVSHRRNSARRRPSLSWVTRPVTSACALMTFQSSKRGAASGLEIFSMNAPLSIGANRPERCRSAAIMPVISAPIWSLARKSVMAIGSGSILPLLTSISTSARAGRVAAALSPAASATAVNINRKNCFMR